MSNFVRLGARQLRYGRGVAGMGPSRSLWRRDGGASLKLAAARMQLRGDPVRWMAEEPSKVRPDVELKEEQLYKEAKAPAKPGTAAAAQEVQPLTRSQVEDRILKVVREFPKIDKAAVTSEAEFKDLGLDSLDSVELVIALEDEFDVVIPDADADKIISCKTAIDYIEALKISTIV